MGSRVQSTIRCFPELCFIQFSLEQVLVGLRKQCINNFVFPTWARVAGLNNNKTDEEGKKRDVSMERSKAGMKKLSLDGLSVPNQNKIIIIIIIVSF